MGRQCAKQSEKRCQGCYRYIRENELEECDRCGGSGKLGSIDREGVDRCSACRGFGRMFEKKRFN